MIVVVGLLFVRSYSIKALATSTLIISVASDRNNTNPKMAKKTVWYLSSFNFPLSLFFFNLASIHFYLKTFINYSTSTNFL
jgi:hypothetical protein